MEWHRGSAEEAIAAAKARRCAFLVLVSGEDEASERMESALDTRRRSLPCVALRLPAASDVCKQFSQIYPVVVVPSVYIIGESGVPLEIIAGHLSKEEFLTKLETVRKRLQDLARSSSIATEAFQDESFNSVPVPENYKKDKALSERKGESSKDTKDSEKDENGIREQVKQQQPESSLTRLQFRFPDGSSVTQQFPTDTTLGQVHQFVQDLKREEISCFTLSTTFPRREFTEDDFEDSLQTLQLSPCAAILVIPISSSSVRSRTPSFGIIWTILAPVAAFFSYLRNYFFGASMFGDSTGSEPEKKKNHTNSKKGSKFSRQDGNVHRIANTDDEDDDDSNTWNGNSTQQM